MRLHAKRPVSYLVRTAKEDVKVHVKNLVRTARVSARPVVRRLAKVLVKKGVNLAVKSLVRMHAKNLTSVETANGVVKEYVKGLVSRLVRNQRNVGLVKKHRSVVIVRGIKVVVDSNQQITKNT